MNRFIGFVLLLLCTGLTSIAQEITVATFNAEFLNKYRIQARYGVSFDLSEEPQDVQNFWKDETNRDAKLKEASDDVAELIKQMNADIMTLTEVGNADDIEVLKASLSAIGVDYEFSAVCECTDSFTGQHVAVLSKYPLKEIWPQITGRSLYLEETDGDSERETGISKGLKVTVTIEDQDIDVFVLHFKSERGGFTSDAQRLAQASIARRAVIQQMNKGRKVIVAGDLNDQKGTATMYRLRGFDDIYEEMIQTGHSQYFENMDVRWTYNYKGEPEQIDHILVSPGLTDRKGIKTSIIKSESVSDHNPVIVKLILK